MKTYMNILIFGLVAIFMTGCATADFNQSYVAGSIQKGLPKIEKTVCIKETSTVTEFEYKGAKWLIKNTNANVTREYFAQYFEQAEHNCFISVETKISNFKSSFTNLDGMDAEFNLEITVSKEGKRILSKNYHGYRDSQVMIALGILGLSAPYKTGSEAFHKELLHIYETDFEKDLLKALKESI